MGLQTMNGFVYAFLISTGKGEKCIFYPEASMPGVVDNRGQTWMSSAGLETLPHWGAPQTCFEASGKGYSWIWARLQSKTGKGRAFSYYLDHHPDYPADSPQAGYGSPHGQEISYIFQNLNNIQSQQFTNEEQDLSEAMATYWTNGVRARSGRTQVAGLQRRPSCGDVLRSIGAHGSGSQRHGLKVLDQLFRLAAHAGGRSEVDSTPRARGWRVRRPRCGGAKRCRKAASGQQGRQFE
jgi:hypothetical protein